MHTAIAITLLFAGATAVLGAYDRARKHSLSGAIVSGVMAAWFIYAAVWMLGSR